MNKLAQATSAYLRTAKDQPVHWHSWGTEPFERAKAEDKPILLDIGAVWCHWCHVMDHESYEDPALAEVLNRDWICIKVDRDERPDVDARYQRAVQAVSGQGGWPLTAFLTPEGEVFYGGTYFPPDGRHGRPGFANVLGELSDRFRNDRDALLRQASEITARLKPNEPLDLPGTVAQRILDEAADAMAHAFDFRYGGFGTLPKFPHPAACDFLLAHWFDSGHGWAREIVERTLAAMANGGIRDHLGGGFHRYSVDARWAVPHFEKMSYDNSELLKAYGHAYMALPDDTETARPELLRQVMEGTVRWIMSTMSDPAGGYYASQDADVTADDDGDYFTWTVDETKAVVTSEEFDAISRYYDIDEVGEMHHNPEKNVLRRTQTIPAIAKLVDKSEDEVGRLIASAQLKMLEARDLRPTPYIDTTLYTGWNAMMASAMMTAGAALERPDLDAHAIATLDLLFSRVVPDIERGAAHAVGSDVRGILDDQVQLANASIDAYEITGDSMWLDRAETLMAHVMTDYASDVGGLRDARITSEEPAFLRQEIRPVQDSPTPSPIGVAAIAMSRLAALTGRQEWLAYRDSIIEPFADKLTQLAVFGATMLQAADWALNPTCHVVIVGGADAAELLAAARRTYRPRKVVTQLGTDTDPSHLPDALRGMLDGASPRAYVCCGNACAPPAGTPEELADTIRTFQAP